MKSSINSPSKITAIPKVATAIEENICIKVNSQIRIPNEPITLDQIQDLVNNQFQTQRASIDKGGISYQENSNTSQPSKILNPQVINAKRKIELLDSQYDELVLDVKFLIEHNLQ